jgi:hypothetical protein
MATEKCPVCRHHDRDKIDKLIHEGRERYDFLARRFDVSIKQLQHHRELHLRGMMPVAVDPPALTGRIMDMIGILDQELRKAEEEQNKPYLFACFREMRAQIDLVAHLTGIYGQAGNDLTAQQERTINRVIDALRDYPDAREAVRKAITVKQS